MGALLVAIYTFNKFSPFEVPGFGSHWYTELAFCLVLFASNGARMDIQAARPFFMIVGLTVLGAFVAVLRSGFSEEFLYYAVAVPVSMLSFMLVLPTIASHHSRRLVVLALLAASLCWLSTLGSTVAQMGDYTRVVLTGKLDRNYMSVFIGLGMLILLGAGLFGFRDNRFRALRMAALLGSLGMLLSLPLTFSRSGTVVGIFMVLVALTIYVIKNRIRGLSLALLLIVLLAAVTSISLPRILAELPSWERHFQQLMTWQTSGGMSLRRSLQMKGLLMVLENPVVGIGAGMSKSYIVQSAGLDADRGLSHNGYLTTWAELGLPGFIAVLLLVRIWVAELRQGIRNPRVPAIDLICVLLGGAMLTMNLFLDFSTVYWFFALVICGMGYERRMCSRRQRPVGLGPAGKA